MRAPTPVRGVGSRAPVPTLRDRLATVGRQRFVGRMQELALVRDALRADEPPFVVLHVHGVGGVGKTTLLRQFARQAERAGRAVVQLDGRDVHASAAGFRRALLDALGRDDTGSDAAAASALTRGTVLMIDTYEKIEPIDRWLREHLLPRLPSRCLVVIAGRNEPAPAWRTDIEWAALVRTLPLGNLAPAEAAAYLAARGVTAPRLADSQAFARGHPLALSLLADVLGQRDAVFDPQQPSDVIRVLIDCFVRDVPSPRHREAIEVAAQVRNTTEGLLAAVLQGDDAAGLFDWLRHLSFIEQGPHGLFPHDLARDVLIAELQWRDPPGRHQRFARAYLELIERIRRASGREQQRLQMEYLFLIRDGPGYRGMYDWSALDSAYAEAATPADHETIAAIVARHEGAQCEAIVRHWLRRQPEGFLVFRDRDARCFGFVLLLDVGRASAEDLAADPALPPALALVDRHDPVRPGEAIAYVRTWMHVEHHQAMRTPAWNLAAMNGFVRMLTWPHIAWNFAAMADPGTYEPHLAGINWPRAPAADFEVGGRRYGVFAHDWKLEPVADWIAARVSMQPWRPMPFAPGADAAAAAAASARLPRDAFEQAVREALRDCARPDRLRASSLLRCGGLLPSARGEDGCASEVQLQALLREAVSALAGHPRDAKLHRVLWLTFVEPLANQEQVAERLDLPFSTYRYRLGKGIERVVDALWQRAAGGT